jgi:cobalt transporter subunit CbtB
LPKPRCRLSNRKRRPVPTLPREPPDPIVAAAFAAAALGMALVYASGFAQVEAVHNAAHDARHAAGFPCH